MSHLEPIRKQQDFLELIVKSAACSSHSMTFKNSCSLFTVGDSIKISSACKNTKIPGICLLMLAISSTYNAKSNGDNTESRLTPK